MNRKNVDAYRCYNDLKNMHYVREAGTSGEKKAAEYIANEISLIGYDSKIEEFGFDTNFVDMAGIEIIDAFDDNILKESLDIRGYINTKDTDESGLSGELVYIENADEISLLDAVGKIAMINGRVSKSVYKRLCEIKAIGFISIVGTPSDLQNERFQVRNCIRENDLNGIPGILIHHNDAVRIINAGVKIVRIVLKQSRRRVNSRNVISSISGGEKAAEIITVTAHYDSVADGPGAYDNLAAAVAILELYRYFCDKKLKRTVQFVWFGGEEYGLKGSEAFLSNLNGAELKNHKYNVNIDLSGQLIGGNVLGITGFAKNVDILNEFFKSRRIGLSFKNQVWSSDSNSFALRGIGAMTLNRDGYYMHTYRDTIDLISPVTLENTMYLLGNLIEYLADSEDFPLIEGVPDEFIKELLKN